MHWNVPIAHEEPEKDADDAKPAKRRRWPVRTLIAVASLVLLFYLAGGWMFSNEIRSGALEIDPAGDPDYDVEVVAVTADQVTLSLTGTDSDHVDGAGIRGIEWPVGAGRVTAITSSTADTVTRGYELFAGSEPLTPGTDLNMHGFVWPADPAALGVPFEWVTFETPLGAMDAIHFPASGDDWVVLVHGKAAPLREAFRLVAPLAEADVHTLVINYRNDPDTEEDPSGFYGYGSTEWQDLEGAVQFALDNGAADIALTGFSMGGGIVLSFALESALAPQIDAIVLDAAMVDFGATIDFRAEDRSLPLVGLPVPQSLTNVAKWFAGWRFDVDWGELDYVDRAAALQIPIYAFHGTADESVPIEPIEELADQQPNLVTLIEVADAGHVLSWNVDPDAYEAKILEFLAEHMG